MIVFYSHKKFDQTEFSSDSSSIIIGRKKPGIKVDLDLSFDPKVSRSHAKISFDGSTYLIGDLNSKNGTFVNDEKITKETKITMLDNIKIGDTILQIKDEVFSHPISRLIPIQVFLEGQLEINYSLLHAGVPFLSKIVLVNKSERKLQDLNLRLILSSYGDSDPIHIAEIVPKEKYELPELPTFSFNRERFKMIAEKEKVHLVVEINGEEIQNTKPKEVDLLPPNAWLCVDHEISLAGFILPNCSVVNQITDRARFELSSLMLNNSRSFVDARESSDPEAVEKIIKAIYFCLQERYGIEYAYEPSTYAPWQTIRFPNEVIENHRGTCIDLAVLFASCVENLNIGIDPIIFLVRTGTSSGFIIQHAVLGFWLEGSLSFDSVLRDCEVIINWVEEEKLLLLDSIGFAQGKQANQNFSTGKKLGREHLYKAYKKEGDFRFIYGVNIAVAHGKVPPMPFGKGLQYERAAHLAVSRARHIALQLFSPALCARHLFLGLLSLKDGYLQQFFCRLDKDIDKIIEITSNSVKGTEKIKHYIPESGSWEKIFNRIKNKRKDDMLVSEEDLIIELFNAQSHVDTVLKKVGLNSEYCLEEFYNFLDKGPVASLWHSVKL